MKHRREQHHVARTRSSITAGHIRGDIPRGISRRAARSLLLIACALTATSHSSLAGASGALAQGDHSDIAAIWNDPVFQKQFIGSYGINADIEPRITQDEVKVLDKIRPLMSEDLGKAETTLAKSMKPDCSAILDFTLGGIRFQQDKLDGALECYKRAVAKFPSFRRAWRNVGLIHARNSEFDDAIRAFTRMIELGGGDSYSYGLLGSAYASKQDYQAAEAAYRNALLLQPDNSEWRLGLTRCVFKQEKFEDAAALLDVLIERFPDKTDFWLLQAQTFLGMKKPLKAAENLEAVALLGRASADSLYTLGDIYISESLPDLALRAYVRAVDADAAQPISRPLLATERLFARGAVARARELAARVHQAFDARMEEAERRKLLKLEARLSMAEGSDSEEMAAVLEELLKLDPLDGETLLLLGQHHVRRNEPDKAIFYFERAESIEACEGNAKLRHAQVLVNLGRYPDALPLLRRAQELKPREDVARYIEQIDRLAKSVRR
jgi:tetratricopeptide (TPR) repeat protein